MEINIFKLTLHDDFKNYKFCLENFLPVYFSYLNQNVLATYLGMGTYIDAYMYMDIDCIRV